MKGFSFFAMLTAVIGMTSLSTHSVFAAGGSSDAACPTCKEVQATNGGASLNASLIKVAQYDYTSPAWERGSKYFCAGVQACTFKNGLSLLEREGFDLIHSYEMIHCEDDTVQGSPIVYSNIENAKYQCMKDIIVYIVNRDHKDNKTTGNTCLYCEELFNIKNSKDETLLDILMRLNVKYPSSVLTDIMAYIKKLGAKRSIDIQGAGK